METRKIIKQLKENLCASIISAVFLSSSFFFVEYLKIYPMEPPFGFSLSDFVPFVIQFSGYYFFIFFFIAFLMTLLTKWLKNVLFKLALYILIGICLAPILYPNTEPPFSYTNIYSLAVIASVLIMGICKEIFNLRIKISKCIFFSKNDLFGKASKKNK